MLSTNHKQRIKTLYLHLKKIFQNFKSVLIQTADSLRLNVWEYNFHFIHVAHIFCLFAAGN